MNVTALYFLPAQTCHVSCVYDQLPSLSGQLEPVDQSPASLQPDGSCSVPYNKTLTRACSYANARTRSGHPAQMHAYAHIQVHGLSFTHTHTHTHTHTCYLVARDFTILNFNPTIVSPFAAIYIYIYTHTHPHTFQYKLYYMRRRRSFRYLSRSLRGRARGLRTRLQERRAGG
jgi:hypothetical protein